MVAQTIVALMLAVIGIHASKLLHDAIPSSVRTGVASAVGTLSWLVSHPERCSSAGSPEPMASTPPAGPHRRRSAGRHPARARDDPPPRTRPEPVLAAAGEPGDIDCRTLVDLVTDHLDGMLDPAQRALVERHLAGCDGCTTYLAQVRETIAILEALGTTPTPP